METDIVHTALDNLIHTADLKAKWFGKPANGNDGQIDLLFEDKKETFFAEVKKEIRHHHVPALVNQARRYKPLIVIAQNIFPAIKEELRRLNIAYIDGAGNMYLKTPRHFVWIDGQKAVHAPAEAVNRAFTKTGLRVIFQFLIQEDMLNAPYRQIAGAAGVALGNIKNVIQGLKDQGFVKNLDDNRLMIINKQELLDRWTAAYAERLKPTLHIGNFRFANTDDAGQWKEMVFKNKDTHWGGEPAADILTHFLQPQILTIYTNETKGDLIKNYRIVPDPEGLVRIYNKFWTTDTKPIKMGVVPPLLIYTDLINVNDPRTNQVADRIFKQYLNVNL
ncbi:MAG TPA: type IV toxin-antitoxin system AbiEi family antitoxin [Cyclobacteriaceae bacterium]|nr:type IV toxin-antitoxin system AbiEi family antitoxin [Cyclobacteriaceae bacterium]